MRKDVYGRGHNRALLKFGFDTETPPQEQEQQPEESHLLRNSLMAAGMAAPWAGLIGASPKLHEGKGALINDYQQFLAQMQPGDILLSGAKDLDRSKAAITSVSGSPESYHAAVIPRPQPGDPIQQVVESSPLPGIIRREVNTPDERMQILRPKFTDAERQRFLDSIEGHAQHGTQLEAALAERLQAHGITDPAVIKKLTLRGRGGMYDESGGLWAGIRELLLPKLRSEADSEAMKARVQGGIHANDPAGIGRAADAIAPELIRSKDRRWVDRTQFTPHVPEHLRGFCSSLPAIHFPEGKNVVPGKLPTDVLPIDYLRSPHMEPVARYNPHPNKLHDHVLRHAPTMMRLGVGAAAAGGIYGASKLINHFMAPKPDAPEGQKNEGM